VLVVQETFSAGVVLVRIMISSPGPPGTGNFRLAIPGNLVFSKFPTGLCENFAKMQVLAVSRHFSSRKECKLEIWGKAQRESAQRPKSDWGKLGGGTIYPASKSRGPNSNVLVYAECALST